METIKLTVKDKQARLCLNRPAALNSLNEQMHGELREALGEVARSDARVLLLTGAGRGFCAGQDLSARQADTDAPVVDLGESLDRNYNPLVKSLLGMRMPVVCAVNGVAAGAGVSIALASDIMVMHESASLVLAFNRIGLVPDTGCSWFLTQALGMRRAKSLAMLGGRIDSKQALDWGLAWSVCADDFAGQVDELCGQLSRAPTKGLGYTKRLFAHAAHGGLEEQLAHERDYQRLAGRSSDYREGVSAFLQKREPVFAGE